MWNFIKKLFRRKNKDIGCMNGWDYDTPKEYIVCRNKKHTLITTSLGRCYTKYECPKCKIEWTVDSGD